MFRYLVARSRSAVWAALAGALVLGVSDPARAASITFVATDLTDSLPGEDLWRYDFTVESAVFNQDDGFAVYFDRLLYADLVDETVASSDWDVLVFQPDTSLPSDGIYDALARTSAASLATPFSVSFRWLGSGTPGSQPFELYHLAEQGYEVLDTGRTASASVPEPATLSLLGLGVLGLRLRLNRVSR